ncbi:MAG: peptide deformylase, partial [Candidatus Neomarinimicrobiota bacterium]
MQLVYYPSPILFEQCQPVPNSGKGQRRKDRLALANMMWDVMEKNRGVGLAAPQVGLNIRMFVWKQYRTNFVIWNPIVCSVSGISQSTEGCLSLPGIAVTKERSIISQIFGTGINGKPCNYNGLEFQ